MQNWNDYQYILALEEAGTMKHAAELLGADPTTVSRHIKRISREAGVTLFQMQKGGDWHVTAEGEKLIGAAKQFQRSLQALEQPTEGQESAQTVKITSLEFMLTHCLAPQIRQGMACFPNTRISLVGADRRLSLAYGEADLALRFGRPQEGQLIAGLIAEIEFIIWSRPQTDAKDWIGLQEDLDWTPEMEFGRTYFKRKPLIRVTSYAAARQAAESTGLPFIAPRAVMVGLHEFQQLPDSDTIHRPLWSVVHESKKFDQRLNAVKSWVKDVVTAAQSEHSYAVPQQQPRRQCAI